MAHFGILCPPISGHLNPLAAVGRALVSRGHKVTILGVQDIESKAHSELLQFAALGADTYPPGTLATTVSKLSNLSGLASLKFSVACACSMSRSILRDAPGLVRREQIDALLVDQNEPSGGSVAEHLGIPFLSVCTSLPLNREPSIPPPFVGWSFGNSPLAKARNQLGYAIADRLIAPIQAVLNEFRKIWKLTPIGSPNDAFSRTATIAQMPREFDFPRERLPNTFHYSAPWFDKRSTSGIPFPWEKLDGRPFVYGSLGTLQSGNSGYFSIMAEACAALDVQLILALGQPSGHGQDSAAALRFAGNPIVVDYAPQAELLARASAVITHAGMNTVLQALHFGLPAVAVPLAHDQPAIAARLARSGAGIVIQPSRLTMQSLKGAVRALMERESEFRLRARTLQRAIQRSGGMERAVDVAEKSTGRG